LKTLHKKILRWTGTFRRLNPADLLLFYAGSMPRANSALWHSHPRNHVPHVHVEAAKPAEENNQKPHRQMGDHGYHDHADHGRGDNECHHQYSREHDDSHSPGHWHFIVPAERLRIAQQLLVFAAFEIWVAIHDLADSAIACRPPCSARAPPPCLSTF